LLSRLFVALREGSLKCSLTLAERAAIFTDHVAAFKRP